MSAHLAVLDSSELRLLGCPVFTSSGELAGIATTLRSPKMAGSAPIQHQLGFWVVFIPPNDKLE